MARAGGAPDNLIQNKDRTKEELSAMGKKGAKVRRDKRTSRERLAMLLQLAMTDSDGNGIKSPITGKAMSVGEAIDTAVIKRAVKGDIRAVAVIYDMLNLKVTRTEITGAGGKDLIPASKMTDEELKEEIKRLNEKLDD